MTGNDSKERMKDTFHSYSGHQKRNHIVPEFNSNGLSSNTAPKIWIFLSGALLGAGILGTVYALWPEVYETEPKAPKPIRSVAKTFEVPASLKKYYNNALQGDAASMRILGVMYYQGLNVPKNREEGLRWYRMAAKSGSAIAGKELKEMGYEP